MPDLIVAHHVVVLNFGTMLSETRGLLEAAVFRVREEVMRGAVPVVVLAAPKDGGFAAAHAMEMVDALAERRIAAVLLTRKQVEAIGGTSTDLPAPSIFRELEREQIVPVIVGDDAVAIALATALSASTTVFFSRDGCLRSGDPKRLEEAVPLTSTSYAELLELSATNGAPVSTKAVELARASRTRLEIRGIRDIRTTVVRADVFFGQELPAATVTVSRDRALVAVRFLKSKRGGSNAHVLLLQKLAQAGIPIELVQFVPGGARFACGIDALAEARRQIDAAGLGSRAVAPCAKISVIGSRITTSPGVLNTLLHALHNAHVEALHFACSNVCVAFVVAEADADRAERALHDGFAIARGRRPTEAIEFDPETGTVRVRGQLQRLGARQARLLRLLLENAGKVVDTEAAAKHLFDSASREDVTALRVHMHNLRKKIERDPENPQYIITVPNKGYTFTRF